MKNLITLGAALLFFYPTEAQKLVEATLISASGDEVHLDFKFASNIKVITWEKKEVLVKASANINDNRDNDLYDLKSEKSGNRLHFYSDNKWIEERKNGSWCCNDNCCKNEILYEVYMPASLDFYSEGISGDLQLEGMIGRIDINTISGNITLKTPPKNVMAKTISGDVELLVNKSDKADMSASTISGDIYSNLNIEYLDNKTGLRKVVGREFRGRINGGGSSWKMQTISGNIFLRAI